MNILFAHNGPLLVDENKRYYNRSMGDSLVRRYKLLGKHVTFLMRKTVISSGEAKYIPQIMEPNFSFTEVPDMMSVKSRLFFKKRIRSVIKRAVQEHDILIARTPSFIGNMALKYAKLMNKPYIVEFVACPWDAMWYYNWKGRIIAPYAYLKNRRAIYDSKHVIYVTKQFLQNRYPTKGKAYSISNVEIDEVTEDVLEKRLEKIERLDLNAPIFLGTAANIDVPYKGQADVIKALYLLKKEGITQFRYRIVGAGNPERLLYIIKKLGMQDFVSIEGPVKHSDILSFYDELDIYIQPSKQEGLPRSVIEAMSRGCPVIGARTGGIPELLDDLMIYKKGKIKQLAEKLQIFINKQILIEHSKRNFEHSKRYEKSVIDEKRRQCYNAFLQNENLV